MSDAATTDDRLKTKYDAAAPRWSDKMRVLGYYDAYLGLLSSPSFRAPSGNRVLDIGCGTGAFAEAWVAIQGPDQSISLLDPSSRMLDRADAALRRRNVEATAIQSRFEEFTPSSQFHCLLAAHFLEHVSNPLAALRAARKLVPKDGRLWLVVSKPHWCNAIIWMQWRHKTYSPTEVSEMLAATGWELDLEYAFPTGAPSRTSRGYLAKAI